jgi:hypothetical protein
MTETIDWAAKAREVEPTGAWCCQCDWFTTGGEVREAVAEHIRKTSHEWQSLVVECEPR